MGKEGYTRFTLSSETQIEAKKRLLELFKNSPIPDDDILGNLGLYTRSVILAKLLYLNELYQQILTIPGIIVEFGVWFGSNLALFKSFRSVYEPYNFTRKVVGFDTFEGYASFSPEDGDSPYVAEWAETGEGYSVTERYEDYLREVLDAQEQDNVVSHIKKYEIVKGNVIQTIGQYLEENRETVIALAYFDLALYEPTKKCLEAIRPHLVHGSVLAMDELNSHHFPGETIALREVLGLDKYRIVKSRFLHDRSYIIID
ncbi:MAG: TylF/MycF/NovP-related O-methyltransferase [Candidatus Hodarchaeota archaeon]